VSKVVSLTVRLCLRAASTLASLGAEVSWKRRLVNELSSDVIWSLFDPLAGRRLFCGPGVALLGAAGGHGRSVAKRNLDFRNLVRLEIEQESVTSSWPWRR